MYSMLGNGPQFMDRVIPILGRLGMPFLYPCFIGLGNRPHMYSMLGNGPQFMDIIILLVWGGQARSFLYPGHIGLGNNRPHMYRMLGNWPQFMNRVIIIIMGRLG